MVAAEDAAKATAEAVIAGGTAEIGHALLELRKRMPKADAYFA